ncbi:hypothetical protein OROHE_008804 [Orobanche hederae]
MARILVFKIRPSQEINIILDGNPLEAEEILTYRKALETDRVARILVFKIRPSQEILKIRDGTPLEKKRVARILVFKIRPSQEINIILDGTPLEAEEILTYRKALETDRVARILVFKIRPSQEILKIRDVKKRVARIMVFKIRPSQEILKIRDGTPLEAEEILTYIKSPRNGSVWYFSSELDVPSNVLQKKRVARILVFKIRPSQEINIILDGTPLEAEEILTYRKALETDRKEWHGFYFSKFGHLKKFSKFVMVPLGEPSQEILKIRDVARILVFKIRPSQEINIILDGTPLEAEEILTYRKALETDRVKKRVARIMVFKIRPSQEILKIRDGTPLEAEEILTYIKSPRNGSVWYFSSELDVPSNVLQKKRVARILVFKIRPSQEINIILDGTPLEAEEILTYRKALETDRKEWHGFYFSKFGHLKKFSKFVMVPLGEI